MEDTAAFVQWAMNTLHNEQRAAAGAAGAGDDCGEAATFPSLQALREASHAAEMVQELIADVHAPNSFGDPAAASNDLPASWNLLSQPAASGNWMMMTAAAPCGLPPPPDLVPGPPPGRRAGFKGLGSMSASYAQDHIIAERKRREKINQRFVELSTAIPGLKKMDKATILSDATRYVKELQEKVRDLEAGRSTETMVVVKRPCLHAAAPDDGGSPLPASPGTPTAARKKNQLPEIEVRFAEKSVMVRVHCENSKGVAVKVLAEVEELHLSLVHVNVMPFPAARALTIAITAKVEEDFTVTADEIAGRLNWICITESA